MVRDGQALRLGGRKPRKPVALLALESGEPVPPDRLIDVLWPQYDEGAPARLQVYVSQLRKALGDPAAIELRAGGYVPAAGGPEDAALLLGEALALCAAATGRPRRRGVRRTSRAGSRKRGSERSKITSTPSSRSAATAT